MEQSVGSWARVEFGTARLGDARRTRRLVQIASGAASAVGAALSGVCGKSGAQTVSRLLDCSEATLESVTKPHVIETTKRCLGHGRVLAIQDTTVLDFSTHTSVEGIGPVSHLAHNRGLLMHSVLCVDENRVPLGIMGLQIWARKDSERGSAKKVKRPALAKESRKWLIGLEQAQQLLSAAQRMLVVGDRESDLYALFVAPRRAGVDLLVRLAHNRNVVSDEYDSVREALASAIDLGTYEVEIPRQGSRPKRIARLGVRVARVRLSAPAWGRSSGMRADVDVSVVWARELQTPAVGKPLDWTLLTTEMVTSFETAVDMVRCYSARWVIEEFHRVLKSGCRVEQMQFDTVDRIKPAVGILAVVAWRVLYLTKYARSEPSPDVSVVASTDELEVMRRWLRLQGGKSTEIHTARDFYIAVARLGGFQGRKSDGMPGTKTTWQGLRNLEVLVLGYKLAAQHEM